MTEGIATEQEEVIKSSLDRITGEDQVKHAVKLSG